MTEHSAPRHLHVTGPRIWRSKKLLVDPVEQVSTDDLPWVRKFLEELWQLPETEGEYR